MAAYISVPRDLTKVKSKVFFNMTKRQMICFGLAALVGVPSFFLFKRSGNISLAAICMIIVMMPFFFLAIYERDGMPMEMLAQHFVEAKFIRPQDRPFCTNNYYTFLVRQSQAEKEVNEIVEKAEKRKEKRIRSANAK